MKNINRREVIEIGSSFSFFELENVSLAALEQLSSFYSPKQVDILKKVNTAAQFEHDLSKQHKIIGCLDRGHIVGFLQYFPSQKYTRLVKMFIHPNYQRQGHGSTLLNYIKKFNKPIIVNAACAPSAIKFYKRNGFMELYEKTKVIKGVEFRTLVMFYDPAAVKIFYPADFEKAP